MARSINKVTLIGVVGNLDFRAMNNGGMAGNISLATDESYMDKNTGQKVEQTEWHRISVFGKLAEICQQYVQKGHRIYVEGKLRTREWEKDGIKRQTTEIVMNEMMLLTPRSQEQGGQQQHQQQQQYQQQQQFNSPQGQQQPQYQRGNGQSQYQQGVGQQQYQQGAGQQQPQYQQVNGQQMNGSFDDDIPF